MVQRLHLKHLVRRNTAVDHSFVPAFSRYHIVSHRVSELGMRANIGSHSIGVDRESRVDIILNIPKILRFCRKIRRWHQRLSDDIGRYFSMRDLIRFFLYHFPGYISFSTISQHDSPNFKPTFRHSWRNASRNLRTRETNCATSCNQHESLFDAWKRAPGHRDAQKFTVNFFLFSSTSRFYTSHFLAENIFRFFRFARSFSREAELRRPSIERDLVCASSCIREWERCATRGLSLASLAVPISILAFRPRTSRCQTLRRSSSNFHAR